MGNVQPELSKFGVHWFMASTDTIAGGGETSESMNGIDLGECLVKGVALLYKSDAGGASDGSVYLRSIQLGGTNPYIGIGSFTAAASKWATVCATDLDVQMRIVPDFPLFNMIGTFAGGSLVNMFVWGICFSDQSPPLQETQPVSLEGYKWPLTKRRA